MNGRHVVTVTTTKRCLAHERFSCPNGKKRKPTPRLNSSAKR
jgi:hypothetical protein